MWRTRGVFFTFEKICQFFFFFFWPFTDLANKVHLQNSARVNVVSLLAVYWFLMLVVWANQRLSMKHVILMLWRKTTWLLRNAENIYQRETKRNYCSYHGHRWNLWLWITLGKKWCNRLSPTNMYFLNVLTEWNRNDWRRKCKWEGTAYQPKTELKLVWETDHNQLAQLHNSRKSHIGVMHSLSASEFSHAR